MTLNEAINQIMTCASDVHCKHEEACFMLAQYAREHSGAVRTDSVHSAAANEVSTCAPSWESVRYYLNVNDL